MRVWVYGTQWGFCTFHRPIKGFFDWSTQRGSTPVAKLLGCGARYLGAISTAQTSWKHFCINIFPEGWAVRSVLLHLPLLLLCPLQSKSIPPPPPCSTCTEHLCSR